MPAYDRVQIMPGRPRTFAVELDTNWQQLPRLEDCLSVFLRPRPGGSATIYLADQTGAGGLDRMV